jgi:transposase
VAAMNHLGVNTCEAIKTLAEKGWSRRRIARELGIHRETVTRYLGRAKPAIPPLGSGDVGDSNPAIPAPGSEGTTEAGTVPKPAIPTAGSVAGRRSQCEPYRAAIELAAEQGLSAQRIYQDLVSGEGFPGNYTAVKRFVRRLRPVSELPFRRWESAPGEEAQVDFGQGAWVVDESGRRRRPHLLRVILSHSRKGYSEAIGRQTTEEFIRGLENAFRFLGGVPAKLVVDNLRAAPRGFIVVAFAP